MVGINVLRAGLAKFMKLCKRNIISTGACRFDLGGRCPFIGYTRDIKVDDVKTFYLADLRRKQS